MSSSNAQPDALQEYFDKRQKEIIEKFTDPDDLIIIGQFIEYNKTSGIRIVLYGKDNGITTVVHSSGDVRRTDGSMLYVHDRRQHIPQYDMINHIKSFDCLMFQEILKRFDADYHGPFYYANVMHVLKNSSDFVYKLTVERARDLAASVEALKSALSAATTRSDEAVRELELCRKKEVQMREILAACAM